MSIASEITRINTNIASAYEACEAKGACMPAVSSRKSAALYDTVLSIPSRAQAPRKAINIYDYDGTRLLSVDTPGELAGYLLTDIAPHHKGLRVSSFNYTVSEISECFRKYGRCDIGVIYTTEDGSGGHPTRLYLSLPNSVNLSPTLYLQISYGNLTIDWGDGSEPNVISESGSSYVGVTQSHTYSAEGDYVISLLYSGEGRYALGQGSASTAVLGSSEIIYSSCLTRVDIGADCAMAANVFRQYNALRCVVIPEGKTIVPRNAFQNCYSLRCLVLPNGLVTIGTGSLSTLYSFSLVSLPPSVTDLQPSAFASASPLCDIILPEGLATIGNAAFSAVSGLTYVALPKTVASIGSTAFSGCANLTILDMRDYTDPSNVPALVNTSAFNGTALAEIWVSGDEMQTAFSAATNWSSFASKFTIK